MRWEASDVVLLEDDIALVGEAKASANATLQLIGSNYKLTVGINTAILAAAAFGRLSPIAASILHNGATIGILLNALRGGTARRRSPSRKTNPSPKGLCISSGQISSPISAKGVRA